MLFFLIPHPWEVPRNRLSGCFPEPLVLLSQFSWLNLRVFGGTGSRAVGPWLPVLRPEAHPGCVLSPSTRSQDTVAKCCLPSSCWTTRASFLEVTTGPSNSGIYAAKSVRKFSLCVCEWFDTNRGAVCFCIKACIYLVWYTLNFESGLMLGGDDVGTVFQVWSFV